jgi:hypothetical protein
MATDSGRRNESLHVLLARAGARVVAADNRDPPRDAARDEDVADHSGAHDAAGDGDRDSREVAVVNIEDEFRKMTAQLQPAVVNDARYDFVRLGEKIAGSLESAALAQVDTAKRILEETRAETEKLAAAIIRVAEERVAQAEEVLAAVRDPATGLRDQIKKVDQELADLNDRLKRFGETVLHAHQTFHLGKIAED